MIKKDKYISSDACTYAKALVELGISLKQVRNIRNIFESTPEISEVLMSPAVSPVEKHRLTDRIFSEGISESPVSLNREKDRKLAASFIKVLLDKERLDILFQILDSAEEMILTREDTRTVTLFFAAMPDDRQLAGMERVLKEKLSCRQINWQFVYDEKLLGGFVIDAGDLYFDYSVRGRLDEMRNKLTGR